MEGGREDAEGHLNTGALLQAGMGWAPAALSPPPLRGHVMPLGEPKAGSRLPCVPAPEPRGSWSCPPNVPAKGLCKHQGAPVDCVVAADRLTKLLQSLGILGGRPVRVRGQLCSLGLQGASGSTFLPSHLPSACHSGRCCPHFTEGEAEGQGGRRPRGWWGSRWLHKGLSLAL